MAEKCIKNILRNTGEFPEDVIEESAECVEAFVKTMLALSEAVGMYDISKLWTKKGNNHG